KADRLLSLRLQEGEREQFTVEERAKFLHDTIAAQRRFLAEQRAAAIRSSPPTRTQLRNQMMTYLKHVGNKKHSDLKNKTFEEIQEMNEEAKDPEQKRLKKRVVKETPKKEDTTKPSDDSDDEHRKCPRIVALDNAIDSEVMETKSVIARLNKVSSPDGDYLVIYRANGNFKAFNYLLEEIVRWRLYEACGVYILELKDGIVIHMLVERRYPLSLLQRMLDLGLEIKKESTAALHLVKFIKQQLNEE
ncbi:hypothetical protein Tco_0290682, partial [Tanacetum coccineum]